MSNKTKTALISAAGTILAAIIGGVFLLFSRSSVNSSSLTGGFQFTSNPTVITSPNPYPPYKGLLVLDNPLHNHTPNWEESSNSIDPGTCKFTAGAYYASQPQANHFTTCIYEGETFTNFTFEVGMTIIQGDCGGIFFDADGVGKHFYYFRICQADGSYVVDVASKNSSARTIGYGSSPAFMNSLGQFNTIAVNIQGNNFDLYVNNQKLRNTWNSRYKLNYNQGFIGVLADNLSLPTTVAFDDAKVWKW